MKDKAMQEMGSESTGDSLGTRIKAVRTALKLRLGDTASKIGVSRTSLGQWEADAVKNPDMEKLAAFTRLTEVSLDWLVKGRGDEPGFLAARRPSKAGAAVNDGSEAVVPRVAAKQQAVPEIAAPLTAHALQIDMTARTLWVIPQEVLELGFNTEPSRAVMKRIVTRNGAAFGLVRGDFVLIDTGRTRIDEPGIYILADPDGVCARRALVELIDGKLSVVQLGDDIDRDNSQGPGDNFTVLGRVMGIFKPS